MKKMSLISFLVLFTLQLHAAIMTCPDPETSSLKWGEAPYPWSVSPWNSTRPQGEEGTKFVQANILTIEGLSPGITCGYRNSAGLYWIWWQILVKRPAAGDYNWIEAIGGYVCKGPRQVCQFSVAVEQ